MIYEEVIKATVKEDDDSYGVNKDAQRNIRLIIPDVFNSLIDLASKIDGAVQFEIIIRAKGNA